MGARWVTGVPVGRPASPAAWASQTSPQWEKSFVCRECVSVRQAAGCTVLTCRQLKLAGLARQGCGEGEDEGEALCVSLVVVLAANALEFPALGAADVVL